jgi:hypothetical protein
MSARTTAGRSAGTVRPRAPRAPAPTQADRRVRRARLARAVGIAGMLVSTVALWWLLSDAAFRVRPEDVDIVGTRLTAREEVLARLVGIDRAPNVLRLRAGLLLESLRAMPEVRAASLAVGLPADVRVTVEEREPIFAWSDGRASWLVDREGVLFGDPAAAGVATTPATGRHADALPTVTDRRLLDVPLAAGARLNPVDLAAMRQLLALEPELVGSDASELYLRIDEAAGYILTSPDQRWRAHLGHYTPTRYPPTRIPLQVQCLATLLAAEEPEVQTVWLVPSDEACGTYTETGLGG